MWLQFHDMWALCFFPSSLKLANSLSRSFSSFHTYDYARHFVSACTRILGIEGTPEGVEDQGRLTRVAVVCSNEYI